MTAEVKVTWQSYLNNIVCQQCILPDGDAYYQGNNALSHRSKRIRDRCEVNCREHTPSLAFSMRTQCINCHNSLDPCTVSLSCPTSLFNWSKYPAESSFEITLAWNNFLCCWGSEDCLFFIETRSVAASPQYHWRVWKSISTNGASNQENTGYKTEIKIGNSLNLPVKRAQLCSSQVQWL